jgi:hypothetical protein
MSARTHPYRSAHLVRRGLELEPGDPLDTALRAAKLFLFLWASLRLAVCTFCGTRGVGFEGALALIVIVSLA